MIKTIKTKIPNKNFFYKILLICVIWASIFSGCDRSYLPWNAATRWSTSPALSNPSLIEPQAQLSEPIQTLQRAIENFCEDNFEDVESYRRFLLSEQSWDLMPEADLRRRRYARRMVEQYDSECN